eukprot:5006480-Amphidinium_carterae.1
MFKDLSPSFVYSANLLATKKGGCTCSHIMIRREKAPIRAKAAKHTSRLNDFNSCSNQKGHIGARATGTDAANHLTVQD